MKRAPIVIHYGCMASEKSLALIQDYRKSRSVGEVCLCYVPSESKDGQYITSRFMAGEGDENLREIRIPANGVANSLEIYSDVEAHMKECYNFAKQKGIVVARLRINVIIDELNLLDENVKPVIEDLAHNGIRVVASGLDLDYRGEPFPLKHMKKDNETDNGIERKLVTVPDIMGIASEIHRHYARCSYPLEDGAPCGDNATRSQRFRDIEHKEPSNYNDATIEVDPRKYMPVCETHHKVPGKHNKII